MKKSIIYKLIILSVLIVVSLSTLVACRDDKHNDMYFNLSFSATQGGTIDGNTEQTVRKDLDATQVTAIADDLYIFTGWCDGITTASRLDTNITNEIHVTAKFYRVTNGVSYLVTEGGRIYGLYRQSILYGNDAAPVTAIANDGWRFARWSDGVETADRHDLDIRIAKSVTAEFERIVLEVNFDANANGAILGNTNQQIYWGDNASEVTAQPSAWFRFVVWSDGVTTATRHDVDVRESFNVRAYFEPIPYAIAVTYIAFEGGRIEGELIQYVAIGGDATPVTAVADEGWIFIGWSDDLMTPTRHDTNIQYHFTAAAFFERIELSVAYNAGVGGRIEGSANQTVYWGEDATSVTAVPSANYFFIRWSDGALTATRHDQNIRGNIHVTAEFGAGGRLFAYQYNFATSNNNVPSVALFEHSLNETNLIVPLRRNFTFGGWYLYSCFSTRVTDASGRIVIGQEIFESNSQNLYARWTGNTGIYYPILMIFVTEFQGRLEYRTGRFRDIHRILSHEERLICKMISFQMSKYLNDWFYGIINFTVDIFFTTEVLGVNNLTRIPMDDHGRITYMIWPRGRTYDGRRGYGLGIPEVQSILPYFRSVITTMCLDDFNPFFKNIRRANSGIAGNKYALCQFEWVLARLFEDFTHTPTIEELSDFTLPGWSQVMQLYLHEFIHTVELAIRGVGIYVYDLHDAIKAQAPMPSDGYTPIQWRLEGYRQFLLNKQLINEQYIGIPICFWLGELPVQIQFWEIHYYEWGVTGGTIYPAFGVRPSSVPFGGEITVTAIPYNGFRFIKWSDGITAAARHDTNIIATINIRPIFAPLENHFVVRYRVNHSSRGAIVGSLGQFTNVSLQVVPNGQNANAVTAMPHNGFRFVKWSDGSSSVTRHDLDIVADFYVMAIFEPIKGSMVFVQYSATDGGRVLSQIGLTLHLEYGNDFLFEVLAIPWEGYRFVKWSDGVLEAMRHDTNITSNINAVAVFERIPNRFFVNHLAGNGGLILGFSGGFFNESENSSPVTAVPLWGYRFVGWSDGVTTATRHDTNVRENISVTAQFERI